MNPDIPDDQESPPENISPECEANDNPSSAENLDGGLSSLLARMAAKSDNPKILRLVVIDNHELFREGMLRLLVMNGHFAPVTGPFAEARSLVQHFWPDLIVLGLGPVQQRGIRLAKTLQHDYPAMHLFLLDETVRARHVREALDMNAKGNWTKHADFAKIIAAMRSAASGDRSFCPEVEKHLRGTPAGLRFDPSHEHQAIALLSPREVELFLLLAQGHSPRQSAEQLGIREKTAERRRANIMRKLKAQEIADLTRLAIKEKLLG